MPKGYELKPVVPSDNFKWVWENILNTLHLKESDLTVYQRQELYAWLEFLEWDAQQSKTEVQNGR
jgi:hypothetical protein